MPATVVLRRARRADATALHRLAALDSARPLRGDVVVAEVEERPVAAISLADGRVVADPFERTLTATALLRDHAAEVRGTARSRRRAARYSRARPRLA